ncbi:MAG: GNAT family N-acetyltransferase, partial [Barnesiella sp.]|nr:GNAT family N-acetyltransferase [Barnesiella sp.]
SALNFYQARGFRIIGRDETDEAGRPYPILHLSL